MSIKYVPFLLLTACGTHGGFIAQHESNLLNYDNGHTYAGAFIEKRIKNTSVEAAVMTPAFEQEDHERGGGDWETGDAIGSIKLRHRLW